MNCDILRSYLKQIRHLFLGQPYRIGFQFALQLRLNDRGNQVFSDFVFFAEPEFGGTTYLGISFHQP